MWLVERELAIASWSWLVFHPGPPRPGTARVALRLGAKQADAKRSRDRQGAHSKAYILSNLSGFSTPSGVFTQTRQGAVFGLFSNLLVQAVIAIASWSWLVFHPGPPRPGTARVALRLGAKQADASDQRCLVTRSG